MKPGLAGMSVFIGLNASEEELNLQKFNTWAFTNPKGCMEPEDFFNLSTEEVMEAKNIPLMFFAFPSAKDPRWTEQEDRKNKSTCTIVALVSWKWFEKFKDTKLKKRGEEYDEVKKVLGNILVEQVCHLKPEIRHFIDYVDIGSPCTNLHYLAQPHGEIYGLDHSASRMDPWMSAQLRPETDIKNLYLTGQDVLMAGFSGGLFSGLFCSAAVLKRNVMNDLKSLGEKLSLKQDTGKLATKVF